MAKKTGPEHFDVWGTAWGPIGAVASDRGLTRVVLPHYGKADLEALLAWEHPGSTRRAEPFEAFRELSVRYFSAEPVDFSPVEVDLPGEGTFFGKVYRAAREIPLGRTESYKQVSMRLGQEDAARAVATALSKNPTPLVVPCHRVIYSNGGMGGFSAEGGEALKRRMIEHERRMTAGPRSEV